MADAAHPPQPDEVAGVAAAAAAPAPEDEDDDLPMKHAFILEIDTPLGQRIVERFGKTGEYRIAGTLRADPVRQELSPEEAATQVAKPLPPWVSEIVPSYLNDNVVFKQKLLAADVIVCPIRDSAHEAAAAVRMLKNAQFDTEKTLVVISSVLTWADTLKAQKAEERAAREAERRAAIEAGEEVDEEDDAAAGGAAGGDGEEEEEEIPPFTEDQYQKRVPHPRFQSWKEVEQAAKAANSETLHTYVLFSGLTYGAGEDMLEPFFKRAWHQQALPLHTDGANVVPMIHIEDLANAAFKAGTYLDVLPTRYILAVDRGNHKWGHVIDALNKAMGSGESYAETRLGSLAFSDWITIDIKLEPATISDLIDESEWVAPEGFVAAADKVCHEYRKARGLTPLRAAVVGPPLVGKSTVAERLAEEYRVRRMTVNDIVSDYTAHRATLVEKIAAHRKARAAAKRKAAKEEKLRAEREALEEQKRIEAEAAAEAEGEDGAEDGAGAAGGADDAGEEGEDGEGAAKKDAFEVSFEIETPPAAEDDEEAGKTGGDGEGGDDEDGGDGDGGAGAAEPDPAADDDEDDEVLNKLKDDLAYADKVLALKYPQTGRFVDEAMAVMGRRAITTAASRNQGYILDGFPKNVRQAAALFAVGDITLPELDEEGEIPPPEEADPAALLAAVDGALLLEHVVVCSASEECLIGRCSTDSNDNHRNRAGFFRRLAQYKADNTAVPKPTHSLEAWLGAILTNDEGLPRAASLLPVDLTSAGAVVPIAGGDAAKGAEHVLELRLNDIRAFLGEPRFVRPTPEMIVADRERAVVAAEEARIAAIREEEAKAAEEAAAAAEAEKARKNDDRRLSSVATERAEANAIAALPMNEYLLRFVAPAVADATAHVCEVRPEDPINTMADYLFSYEVRDTSASLRKPKRVNA